MQRALYPEKSLILTEGKSDSRIHKRILNEIGYTVLALKGSKNAIDGAERARLRGDDRVMALVDSDGRFINNELAESETVHVTEFFDVEGYAIFSDAWNRVFSEWISEARLSQSGISSLENLRDRATQLAYPIGLLRTANRRLVGSCPVSRITYCKKTFGKDDPDSSISSVLERYKQLVPSGWDSENTLTEANELDALVNPKDHNKCCKSIDVIGATTHLIKHFRLLKSGSEAPTPEVLIRALRATITVSCLTKFEPYQTLSQLIQ